MIIEDQVYFAFYELLRKKFFQDEWRGEVREGRNENSPQLWKTRNPKNGKIRILEIIEYVVKDEHYFYRLKSLFKSHPGVGYVNDTAFYKAAWHCGIRFPQNSPYTDNDSDLTPHSIKAEVLLEEFKKKYFPSISSPKQNSPNPADASDLILTNKYPGERKPSQRELFGFFEGTAKQGNCTDQCVMELYKTGATEISGKIVVDYDEKEYGEVNSATLLLSGMFLNDRFLPLIYRSGNPEAAYCGVMFLELSSLQDFLSGDFMGFYTPKSLTRGENKGKLMLRKKSIPE